MTKLIQTVFVCLLSFSTISLSAQLDWARIGIVCPCSLESTDGKTATVQLGIRNFEQYPTDNLYATIGVTGEFLNEEYRNENALFLGTAPLDLRLDGFDTSDSVMHAIVLGRLPEGRANIEILIHEGPMLTTDSLLDYVWLDGETDLPFTSLKLQDMDFLKDSDGDGVDDVNERLMGTDANDPADLPDAPEIDVVVAYDSELRKLLPGSDPRLQISHIFAVTNYIYQSSGSPLNFRMVAALDEDEVPEVIPGEPFLPDELRDRLKDDYGADVILVLHPSGDGLCGIAQDIGGWRGRGFLLPSARAILTHVWVDPLYCPVDVTAHEIGHLMGLGHSYLQESIGTYYWSRGHGEIGAFGTVMTYHWVFDAIAIDKFSNPDQDCYGHPCGVAHTATNHEKSSNATLSVNVTKYQFATTSAPSSTKDEDGDGFAADVDRFPLDPLEWNDSDGDGYGDNRDAFPNLASEWNDTDGDGIGDNSDPDIDGDGVVNNQDVDPFDRSIHELKILKIDTLALDDGFGREAVRTSDWDDDGLEDIAIAAPTAMNAEGEAVGAVYLFSHATLSATPTESPQQGSLLTAQDLLQDSDGWMLVSPDVDSNLGSQMASLAAGNRTGNLVVSSTRGIYMIQLDSATLPEFDSADGAADRKLHLQHCDSVAGCWFVPTSAEDFFLRDIAVMHDRDGDEQSDLAILYSRLLSESVSLYLLTASGVQSANQASTEEASELDDVVTADANSYHLKFDENPYRPMQLTGLGDVSGYVGHELGIALESAFNFETYEFDAGKYYILNTELTWLLDLLDGAQDKQVQLDEYIDEGLGSYEITYSFPSSGFGRRIDAIEDLDNDDKPDILLWSGDPPHRVVTANTLEHLDLATDGSLDGKILLSELAYEQPGVWHLGNSSPSVSSARRAAVLNSALGREMSHIVAQRGGSSTEILVIPQTVIDNPEYDLDKSNLGVVEIFSNIGPDRILRVAADPSPRNYSFDSTGFLALGDMDADVVGDFLFAEHVQNADARVKSVVNVVFSNSLHVIDLADGNEDGLIYLHNNLDDSDGDGITNLYDLDDDEDGVHDQLDRYPLNNLYSYDSDGDGLADELDPCPTNSIETEDLDGDGLCDFFQDFDIDNDGITDFFDEFPRDTDNDGEDNDVDLDDDGDGVEDLADAFPLDPSEQYDADGDGIGDNADLFDDDANEWSDFDEDGIGDQADLDDDNDGYHDVDDWFPFDATEWADTDRDGVGDNEDAFPLNPFEWEDSDGDGVGERLGMSQLATHRLESEWIDSNFSGLSLTRTFDVGNYDRTAGSSIVIHGGIPHDIRGSFQVLSSTDLQQLDALDQNANQRFRFGDISQGASSWMFRGEHSTGGFPSINDGALLDIDRDSIGDLVIGGPDDNWVGGAVYIVRGSEFAAADALDGTADGKINHSQCAVNDLCVAIRNLNSDIFAPAVAFGWKTTSLRNLFGHDSSAVAATNFNSVFWSDSADGDPMLYLFSDRMIWDMQSETQDNELILDELVAEEESYQVFSEFSESHSYISVDGIQQLTDYDNDSSEDLLLSMSTLVDSYIYLLSSSDIRRVLANEESLARRINIGNIREQPDSFRFDGFTLGSSVVPARTTGWDYSSETSQIISMLRSQDRTLHLVDVSDLAEHDAVDGEADGIVTEINTQATNSWSVHGVQDLSFCGDIADSSDGIVFGSYNAFIQGSYGFHMFRLNALPSLALAQDESDNNVDISAAAMESSSEIWTISLGDFENFSSFSTDLLGSSVSCIGDWDNDGVQDLGVSLLQYRNYDFFAAFFDSNPPQPEVRSTLILLMSGDLPVLDRFDGSVDNVVDLSLIWSDTSGRLGSE